MFVDFMSENGSLTGNIANQLQTRESRFDPGILRPFINNKGQKCVTLQRGPAAGQTLTIKELMNEGYWNPIYNATSLRKAEWEEMDKRLILTARPRLRAWGDLEKSNVYSIDGMSKSMLEHETQSDPGEAMVDMDGLSDGKNDATVFQMEGLPLPIVHADFYFSLRKLNTSRNGGQPIDYSMAEACARRVAESIEKTTIGTLTGITYGAGQYGGYGRTSKVYGYTNFPSRITKTDLTVPTGSNPEATVNDVLSMRSLLYANNMFGPYMVYHSTDWDQFMDNDYARLGGNNPSQTLRNRIRSIEGILDVRRLDYLTSSTNPYTLLVIQMSSDVARAVRGLSMTTVQWESKGGLQLNFKVMAIMVPQLRADYYGHCGICHGTTS